MKKNKFEVHSRKKYLEHSRRFVDWVDNLGFERTRFGQVVQFLEERFQIRKLLLLFLYGLALSTVLFLDLDYSLDFAVGDLAKDDVKSPVSFQLVDHVATAMKRAEAEQSSLPVYDYDPEAFEPTLNRLYGAFRRMRDLARQVKWPQSESQREIAVKDFVKNKSLFEEDLGVAVRSRDFEWLVQNRFSVRIENTIVNALSRWSSFKMVNAFGDEGVGVDRQVILRTVDPAGAGEERTVPVSEIIDLRKANRFDFSGVRGASSFESEELEPLKRLTISLLVPNLTFNKQETASRKNQARESVLPVQISISKNQTIVTAGTRIQPIHVAILNEIKNLKSDRRQEFAAIVSAFLFVVLALVFFSYFKRFTNSLIKLELKELLVMGLVALLVSGLTKLFLFMTDAAFVAKFAGVIPPGFFAYASPIASGAMLVGLLIASGEVVLIFTTFLAVTLALLVDMNYIVMVLGLVGGVAAAYGVHSCEKRNDIYWAGVRTGAINAAVIVLLLLIDGSSNQSWTQLLWNGAGGFLGGVFSSMVAITVIPVLESAFNFTTDIKLLELSNLNHPLMKQMMVKAPGTYHHSLAVGTMVEEAATEIGANPLLAKVMAYYHDIGKMEHAQYFAENQRPGYNPHDQITPYMSKTILVAHVKDGAEMGLQYKLGKPIIDGILQHHGTTLISYFYNKAVADQDEDLSQIEDNEFRYPGPKPQFKEAALVMLGDSIEAAARSMEEPTATRLTHLVKNIIQNKFIDGQLDECNLTLKELSLIENAFKRTILSIYHQRIDYPHMRLGAPIENNTKNKKNLHSVGN